MTVIWHAGVTKGSLFIVVTLITVCCSIASEDVGSIRGYYLDNVALKLGEGINKTNDEELGVPFIWTLYSKFRYKPVVRDVEQAVYKIAAKLELKLNESFAALNVARMAVENSYSNLSRSAIFPCSRLRNVLTQYEVFNLGDNSSSTYWEQFLSIDQLLMRQESSLVALKGAVKQFYFLSSHDVSNETQSQLSRCDNNDLSLLWKTFMNRVKRRPRNVVLLLDHGGSLSKYQFQIVKAMARQMLSTLDSNDRIGVLAISEECTAPYVTEQCLTPNQARPAEEFFNITFATEHNKDLLNKFVNSLVKGSGGTNHSLGFQQALYTIVNSNIPDNETVMLLYISRGLLSSLREAKTVLQTISDMVVQINNTIIINTCAVINESKPVMYEMHFLRDIAKQNYTKYNINMSSYVQKGLTLSVYSLQNIGLASARFYNVLKDKLAYEMETKISLPQWDEKSKDLAVSITVPCGNEGEIGVLGMDIYLSSLAEDVIYYSNHDDYAYAFIIDTNGLAISHPSYPRPGATNKQPKHVDISYLEKIENFSIVREKMLRDPYGRYTLFGNEPIKYVWKNVLNWYIVCIGVKGGGTVSHKPHKISGIGISPGSQLVHHRLDIVPAQNLCRHFNQLATMDAGSLYLSPSCFLSPFHYMRSLTDSPFAYMAYLKDTTRLLANPGLREDIRDDVSTLSLILDYLRDHHLHGLRSNYIVRRYVTSYSGVLQMFPGGIISSGLEPTKRSWFLRAVEYKQRTILTPPYLDAGGAGYIVTLAYATSHVVVAMDVTYGYIYRLLLEQMPFCAEKNVKCFMMDDRGYLVYHPNLIDPNGHGPIEQQHIIHKESLVANDILNHKDFIKKMLCNSYNDGTIQRYYRLNTSLDRVLVNAVHGEHCVQYQVAAVKDTNVFVGVINTTCESTATFCPCSIIDRICLNCNSMEQKLCECPCECPLNLNSCTQPNKNLMDNPLCSVVPEQTTPIMPNAATELKPCISFPCENYASYESCLGITGCEWCQMDVDGRTFLQNPFCTSITTCFNGVLGSVTPYGDAVGDAATSKDLLGPQYSPVGPVIGSVIGMCLVLTLLFFCYRSYTSHSVEHFYLTSTQDNQVRMSDLNISDDYHETDNHQDKLLLDCKKPEPISPYCVSTAYRRPPTIVDSDHGYSTMTPHDESEHLSFAPVEIDSLEDDCTSDNTSINTSVSSKPQQARCKMKLVNPQLTDLQMTAIPHKNCIIAPVTVHRNMETTQ